MLLLWIFSYVLIIFYTIKFVLDRKIIYILLEGLFLLISGAWYVLFALYMGLSHIIKPFLSLIFEGGHLFSPTNHISKIVPKLC
jgi:hypothetical protein